MTSAQHWNERFAGTDRLFSPDPDDALVEFVAPLPPGGALDLGAGEGRNSLWLAGAGWRVTAVDHAEVALGRLAADAAARHLAVTTVAADIGGYLRGGERFDLVVLANIHPAADERADLLAAAAGAVAPGGHLFLVGHHLDSFGQAGPPHAERLYTEDLLAAAFPGLDVLRLERREREHGDRGTPMVDVVAWATRPAAAVRP